jgi:hypothetical protein
MSFKRLITLVIALFALAFMLSLVLATTGGTRTSDGFAVATTAPSRGHFAYRVMVNTRLRGGLILKRGDRVVCRNPGRWLAVTLPAPNNSRVMRAKAQIVSARSIVRLTVTKSIVTGRGVITCTRLRS